MISGALWKRMRPRQRLEPPLPQALLLLLVLHHPQSHRSSSAALYGNQYPTSRAQPAPTHQYYGAAQTPVRPQQQPVQRAPSTAPVPYPSQRAAVPASFRPSQSYINTPNYGQTAPRPVQQYPSTNQTQYVSTPVAQSYMRPTTHALSG